MLDTTCHTASAPAFSFMVRMATCFSGSRLPTHAASANSATIPRTMNSSQRMISLHQLNLVARQSAVPHNVISASDTADSAATHLQSIAIMTLHATDANTMKMTNVITDSA